MDLPQLIIIAHARAHAAELAVLAQSPDAARNELAKLRKMLNNQLYPKDDSSAKKPSEEDTV